MRADTLATITAHMLIMPAAFIMLYAWSRAWASTGMALAVCVITLAYMTLVFNTDYTYGLWSIAEMGIVSAGLLAARRRVLFVLLLVLAVLNRETGLILVAGYWLITRDTRGAVMCGAIGAAVLIVVRLLVGQTARVIGIEETLILNLTNNLPRTIAAWIFLAPAAWVIWSSWRDAGKDARRIARGAAVYAAFFVAFALWNEVRVLLGAVPFIVPLIVTGLRNT